MAATDNVGLAAESTVASLFDARVQAHPTRVAVATDSVAYSYRELARRTRRLASLLATRGVRRGTRIGLLAENRPEYFEIILAAARLGAIVACQSTRAASLELGACLDLVEPVVTMCSPGMREQHDALLSTRPEKLLVLGPEYEEALAAAPLWRAAPTAEPTDILIIIYTSGTTGAPKGACISHRAEITRSMVTRAELGLAAHDSFVAWSPLSHMGALDNSLSTLLSGGKVIVVDGFNPDRLAEIVATERLGWLLVMPGTVERLAAALRASGAAPAGVKVCGVMPDLIRPAEIAEITTLLRAPFANTFGSTETGNPPCSANVIPVGQVPDGYSKEQSAFCEVRLVDPDDVDVPDGVPGELCMRGPTMFSGYWNNPQTNAKDFRGGWFHLGDVLVRRPDGLLDFVDRVKYMIKSGGENIYPAEIERALLQDPDVLEAAVVRRADPKWGEVPVAFVACTAEGAVSEADLIELCRRYLASHKAPKEIRFVPPGAIPRGPTGKIQRQELEKIAAGG